MIETRLHDNFAEVRLSFKKYSKDITKATVRTLNESARKAKTKAKREVTKFYDIKAGFINRGIHIEKANYNRLQSSITAIGKNLPLSRFSIKKTNKGVSFRIKRGSKRGLLKNTFIAKMPSGHIGVFERKEGAKHKKVGDIWQPALPIKERFTIGLPFMFGARKVIKKVYQMLEIEMPKILERNINYYANRK